MTTAYLLGSFIIKMAILTGPCYSQYLDLTYECNCVRLNAPNKEPIPDQPDTFLRSKHKDLH